MEAYFQLTLRAVTIPRGSALSFGLRFLTFSHATYSRDPTATLPRVRLQNLFGKEILHLRLVAQHL